MAKYLKLISSEHFNEKYKNRFRDFYVYQFKISNDFYKEKQTLKRKKDEVTKKYIPIPEEEIDNNKNVSSSELQTDSKRLQSLLSKEMGVEWHGKKDVKKCLSVDTRILPMNPIFMLYRTCHKRSESIGENFAIILIIIMFFKSRNHDFTTQQFSFDKTADEYSLADSEINELKELIINEICDRYIDRKHYNRAVTYNEIPVNDRIQELNLIDNIIRSSFDCENANDSIDNRIKELYNNMLMNGLKLNVNDLGELELQDDDLPISAKQIEAVVKSILNVKIKSEMIRTKLNQFAEYGILVKENGRYNLSNINLPDFKDDDFKYRFMEMIKFFSETQPFGEVGAFLLNRIGGEFNSCLKFKHNYLLRALNDYNLIDILYAIKQHKYIKVEYRSSKPNKEKYTEMICFPLEVRESTLDGRQHLVYYNPVLNCASALRIDSIDKVLIGTIKDAEDFEKSIEICKEKIGYVFGVSFPFSNSECYSENCRQNLIHVQAVIKYNKENEGFIARRINREIAPESLFVESIDYNYTSPEYGDCIKISVNITSANEFVKWLRTFTCRVVSITIDGEEYIKYQNDIDNICTLYFNENAFDEMFSKDDLSYDSTSQDTDAEIKKVEFIDEEISIHSILFNELFSSRLEELMEILFNDILASEEPLTKREQTALKKQYTKKISEFSEDNVKDIELISNQIDYFVNSFVCNSDKITLFDDSIKENLYSILPLLSVEKQWLNNILKNDKALLFLNKNEISQLLEIYSDSELFSLESINCYNQYRDNAELYKKENTLKNFNNILECIKDDEELELSYNSVNEKIVHSGIYKPLHIEYSKRDDIFRIYSVCDGIIRILNLERIIDCSISKNKTISEKPEIKRNTEKIVIEFKNHKNIPDRILNEFAPWEKECTFKKRTGMYTMSVMYDSLDKLEIVIRLLGYGCNIHIVSDSGEVRNILFERIKMQNNIFREIERAKAKLIKEAER